MNRCIPVKNIYYLLCYAWGFIKNYDEGLVGLDGIKELPDFFGVILARGAEKQIKQGLERKYVEVKNEIPAIKGRFCVMETERQQSLKRLTAVCEYSELDYSTLSNQILKSTLMNLLRFRELDLTTRGRIRLITRYMVDIPEIEIHDWHFRTLRFHRNNYYYGFLMNVCELIYRHSLVGNGNDWRFIDFDDDECMNQIFESYVRKFFELNNHGYKVDRKVIKWNLAPVNNNSSNYLPSMNTDVCVSSSERIVTIDAKWYREVTKSRYVNSADKFHAQNIYQIHSYLSNLKHENEKKLVGVLLYPKTSKSFNEWYISKDYVLGVVTIDLSDKWDGIETQMKELLVKSFSDFN